MSFTQAVRNGFAHYANGKGRAGRAEYFWWLLFTFIVVLAAAVIDTAAGTANFAVLAYFALLLPSVAVGIRRLHDTDRPGGWLFLVFVPIVGPILVLVWFLSKGMAVPNRYGDPPGAPASPSSLVGHDVWAG